MGIGKLVCGSGDPDWIAHDTLIHYKDLLDKFYEKLSQYRADMSQPDALMFSAFCARVIVENSATIISGRLDPFRMMVVRNFQAQDNFDYGKPLKAGYKWTPDIVPKEKIIDIWKKDMESEKIIRSLFSPYYDELFWRPAFINAIDYIDKHNLDRSSLINEIEPENFIDRLKSNLSRLYSLLSKGVHWDYLMPAAVLDRETLVVALEESLSYIALLAFISHFIPTAYSRLDKNQAHQLYSEV